MKNVESITVSKTSVSKQLRRQKYRRDRNVRNARAINATHFRRGPPKVEPQNHSNFISNSSFAQSSNTNSLSQSPLTTNINDSCMSNSCSTFDTPVSKSDLICSSNYCAVTTSSFFPISMDDSESESSETHEAPSVLPNTSLTSPTLPLHKLQGEYHGKLSTNGVRYGHGTMKYNVEP